MTETENHSTNPDEKTVDLAELTRRLGEPEHRQQMTADFADSQGPWTEAEADLIVRVWTNTDAETGVYTDPDPAELVETLLANAGAQARANGHPTHARQYGNGQWYDVPCDCKPTGIYVDPEQGEQSRG